jgi:hypothetical protein
MGTSDLFRNLEWQIETYLAEKTIENLREGWSWEMTPEENLTVAVTNAVPFIFKNHGRWCEERLKWELEQVSNDHPPV